MLSFSSPYLSSPSALRVSARVLRAAAPRRKSIATSMARTDDIHNVARLGQAEDLLKLLDAGRDVNERDTVRALHLGDTLLTFVPTAPVTSAEYSSALRGRCCSHTGVS
jgi:hypothetical protein